jgi:mannose-6-phosphate isomerase-like protein (cupin superfamily)
MVVTMRRLTKPVQVSADSDRFGQRLLFATGRFDCKVSAKDTDGNLCVYDTIRTKQGGPPLHYHHTQDEWFLVRDGEFLFQIGEDKFRLKAGDSILGPTKIPHAFANVSEAGLLMIVFQPAGTMEQFFLEGSRLTNPSQQDLQALYRAHAMEILGPPLEVD